VCLAALRRIWSLAETLPAEPTFVVDVGHVFEEKQRLVLCYASQLKPDGRADTDAHLLFGADILQRMETRARFFGERIGARYGEPLVHKGPLPCMDPILG